MGKAILDIWFRDEKCRPIYNLEDRERWDWVEIYNCMGELVGERVAACRIFCNFGRPVIPHLNPHP